MATIHHVRQYMEGELKIDRLLDALSSQTDLPESILILDTQPSLPQPHLERHPAIAGRIRILSRPMRTIQEGFNFYPHARNQLLKECDEEVVIWLDADERPDPDVVEKVRARFSDPSTGAAVLCNRHMPGYWGIADDLQYIAKEGHIRARLRIFRTDLLRSLGGFEPGKPEWGSLASRIYPLAEEGRLTVSHDRLYAWHDCPVRIVSIHFLRLFTKHTLPRGSIYKARALLGAFALSVALPAILGRPILGLAVLLAVPGLLYLFQLARCLRALGSHGSARPIHAPGAALLGAIDTLNHVLSTALSAPR